MIHSSKKAGGHATRLLQVLRILGAALLLLLPPTASFAEEPPRVPVDQRVTQQKAELLNRLVTRSVAAQRITESGDTEALAKLESARELVRAAESDLKAGNYVAANDKLDAALELVNSETRRLSEDEVAAASLQRTYERRLKTVQTFLAAYERVASEKQPGAAAAAQVQEIKRLVGEAEALAAKGELQPGIERLDRAYLTARGDIRELREGETLTRSLNFETAEAEYDYEKNRNDSHIMLLKFAISEQKPGAERMAAIERLRAAALALRSDGEQLAGAGDYAQAIRNLAQSTEDLLKAIRMSGIYIPG